MQKRPKIVIFTDLDGTLLDHETYSFKEALPALEKIKKTATPVVFVTSKTFAEVKAIQQKMALWKKEPFIIENGGAIYVPKKFFNFNIKSKMPAEKIFKENDFFKIEFGRSYEKIRQVLKEAAKEVNLNVIGIGDRTTEEFAKITGLDKKMAALAKQRQYQEGFTIENVPASKLPLAQAKIRKVIEKRGYFMSIGGRFCQISGIPAKTKAVKTLIKLFYKKYGQIRTVGLGDAQADLEFMELCDIGFLIKNPKKIIGAKVESEKIHKTREVGPRGWNKIILAQFKLRINRF